MPDNPTIKPTAIRAHQETTTIDMAPGVLSREAINLQGGVLTVKNEELASVIQSKLAAASKLAAGRVNAADTDVSVSVKVHF